MIGMFCMPTCIIKNVAFLCLKISKAASSSKTLTNKISGAKLSELLKKIFDKWTTSNHLLKDLENKDLYSIILLHFFLTVCIASCFMF